MAKKKIGILKKIFLSLLVLLVVLLTVVYFLIDPIAKYSIENVAPLVLGTDISLESIHIKPFSGRVEITNFVMMNPPNRGYASENAIKLGNVIADVDLGTVTKDKIRIEELRMKDVNVNYETSVISSNLQDILANLKKQSENDVQEEKVEEATGDKTLQVDVIQLDNVGISVQAKGVATGVPIHVTIDPMGPLGETEGITPVELSLHILGAIVTTAVTHGGGAVGEAADTIKDAATNAAAGAGAAAVDAANKTADKIKNLFGGKDNE